jgi:hypothetical protein
MGDYETFRDAYPVSHRVGGARARSAFSRALLTKASLQTMLAALDNHKASQRWADGYVPLMTTWLSQERWFVLLAPAPKREAWCLHEPPCRRSQEHIQRTCDEARALREART